MKYPFTYILLLFTFAATAQVLSTAPNKVDSLGLKQGQWIYYYDQDWNILEDSAGAQFYRTISYQDSKPFGALGDYYRNGQLQMSAEQMIRENPDLYEGLVSQYSEEGNVTLVEFYKDGQLDTVRSIAVFEGLIEKYQKEIPNHPDLAFTANNLAYLYREQKNYLKAEEYYLMAKEIREVALEPGHVVYGNSCNKLAYVYLQQGKYDQAEPLYLIAKEIHGEKLGKESDYYRNARGSLSYIYFQTERYELALPLIQEACQLYLKSGGADAPSYLRANYQLARAYAHMKDRKKAKEAYLLSKQKSSLGKEDKQWFDELMK